VPLELLARAAAAMELSDSVVATLRRNALADPVDAVRLATLEQLTVIGARSPARTEAFAAFKQALQDADPRVRMLGIAMTRTARTTADALAAAEAFDAFTRPAAVIAELLDRVPTPEAAAALLSVLDEPRCGPEAAPAVERLIRRESSEPLRSQAERALAMLRERAVEGRGQISLSAPDSTAGALSESDEKARLSLAKKQSD
jgi:hypothetical protein